MGSGLFKFNYAPRRLGELTLDGGNETADYNGESGELRLINGFSSLLFAKNNIKFYEKKYITIRNEVELINSLMLSTGFTTQERKDLRNSVNKSIFNRRGQSNVPDNPDFKPVSINHLLQAEISLEYTPEHYYRMFRGKKYYENSSYPTLFIHYKRAFPYNTKNKNTTAFHRLELSVNQNIEFGFLNNLMWYVNAGNYLKKKNLHFADFKHFAATRIPVTAHVFNRNFSLLNNYKYSTDTKWVQVHFMWEAPYLFLKKLPFLQKKYVDEALHVRCLWVQDREFYTETGYSIGFSSIGRFGVFVGLEKWRYQSVGVTLSFPLLKYVER